MRSQEAEYGLTFIHSYPINYALFSSPDGFRCNFFDKLCKIVLFIILDLSIIVICAMIIWK